MTASEPQGLRMVEPTECPHCGEPLSIKVGLDVTECASCGAPIAFKDDES